MWIEKRGQQHRVYWRNQTETGPKRSFEPFATRDQAELFRQLARTSSLTGALAWLHNPSDEVLMELLGLQPKPALQDTSTATQAVVGVVPSTTGVGDRYDARVGVTFAHLWQRFLDIQRHLEGTTAELYEMYGRIHLLPFFGDTDLGLIQRTEPLRVSDGTALLDGRNPGRGHPCFPATGRAPGLLQVRAIAAHGQRTARASGAAQSAKR